MLIVAPCVLAQWATGDIKGTLRGTDGLSVAGVPIVVTGVLHFRATIHTGADGGFAITVPYGRYLLNGVPVFAAPRQTTSADLVIDPAGAMHLKQAAPGVRDYPGGFSLPALLLSREPSAVVEPLDFSSLSDNRPGIVSEHAVSWTSTRFEIQGIDATDSYQPGHPLVFPDMQAVEAVAVRGGEAGVFLAQPAPSWHGVLATSDTGASLSASNLPAPDGRGLVQQAEQFRWMTRDELQIGGPITRLADIFAGASGQWDAQNEPLATPGTQQRSRLLFANARGRVRAGAKDQFDALYSGSRIDLSDGGVPAGLEALGGNRLAPSFVLPGGFSQDPETDHFDFVQAGWVHTSEFSNIEVRYGYSTAHLDTSTVQTGESRIELLGGAVTGAPPLANLAVRPRHQIEGAWSRALGTRQRITAGAAWEASAIRNRFSTPSGRNLITADGVPAFLTVFNTPLDSRERVRSISVFTEDQLSLTPSLSGEVGVRLDFSRGAPAAQADVIVWNSIAPHAGVAWRAPHSHGLVLRGAWSRLNAPLAGRYLDFGNAGSLGGSTYKWDGSTQGRLLLRFGGPYSSIAPSLRRPYSDQFDVGAEFPVAPGTFASLRLFRRDDKDRIAATDTGVPASAFTPVTILDPGPDGVPGTFDDQSLTVYAQNPATLGQDRYLLTNPPGLRMLYAGLVAEAGTEWRTVSLHASFVAEKTYGPANPGDAPYENDPGVIGSLFLDPNTVIHAAGRSFLDRAYIGKIRAAYRLPTAWGGIELASVADYMDGLVFARELLVTGLPQGPFLVATTVRGSPGGGNRAQYVLNWNLRASRRFALPLGGLEAIVDLMNANNSAQRVRESDLSGPSFNLRLPVAIQPARFLRIGFRYDF